ncbi:MAG: hypothetical protein NNA20_00025 [Nitrospira sp.]|nr:hypothetical protein [Nitrospira sp.]
MAGPMPVIGLATPGRVGMRVQNTERVAGIVGLPAGTFFFNITAARPSCNRMVTPSQ